MVTERGSGVREARSSLRCGGRQGSPLAEPRSAELRELKNSSRRP